MQNGHDKATAPYISAFNAAMADARTASVKRAKLEEVRRATTDDRETMRRLDADIVEAIQEEAEARYELHLADGRLRAVQAGHHASLVEPMAHLHALTQMNHADAIPLAAELMRQGVPPAEAAAWAITYPRPSEHET